MSASLLHRSFESSKKLFKANRWYCQRDSGGNTFKFKAEDEKKHHSAFDKHAWYAYAKRVLVEYQRNTIWTVSRLWHIKLWLKKMCTMNDDDEGIAQGTHMLVRFFFHVWFSAETEKRSKRAREPKRNIGISTSNWLRERTSISSEWIVLYERYSSSDIHNISTIRNIFLHSFYISRECVQF